MKKLVLLTSVLALAACGGGSGGSGGGAGIGDVPSIPDTPIVPDIPTIEAPVLITETISDTVRASNASVTGIALDNRAELIDMVEQTLGKTYQDEETSATTYSLRAGRGMDNDKRWEWAKGKINHMGWFDKSDEDLLAKMNEYKEQGEEAYNKFINDLKDAFTLVGGDKGKFDDFLDSDDCAGLAGFIAGIIGGDLKDDFEQTKEDMQYKEFDLGGVEMTLASSTDDNEGTLDVLTFGLGEDGSIIAADMVSYVSDNGEGVSVNPDSTTTFTRKEDNVFELLQKDVSEDRKLEGTATVQTYGAEYGLRYSDFGGMKIALTESELSSGNIQGTENSIAPFAGGYADKKIARSELSGRHEFAGYAVGAVAGSDNSGNELSLGADATLVFADGTETINMNFSENNWYDVEIVKTSDSTASISFSNGENVDDNYRVFIDGVAASEKTVDNYITGNYNGGGYDESSTVNGKLEISYYGVKGNPNEVNGVTQYVETVPEGEIRMNVAFGAAK